MKADDPDLKVFDELPTHVLAIDAGYEVVYANHDSAELMGAKCYKVLWGLDGPCADCQLAGLLNSGKNFKKSGQTQKRGQVAFLSCEYRRLHGMAVCFIDDKTQVVSALKRAKDQYQEVKQELSVQEEKFKAQALMLKHKLKTSSRKLDQFPRILDSISPGYLHISENKQILSKNRRVGEMLQGFWGEKREFPSCHQLLYGKSQPCEDCPISGGRLTQMKRTQLMKGSLGEGYVTEEISKLDDDYVLTVTNSTRTIEIAKEIQSYIKEMTEINQILNEIMAQSAALQSMDEISRLFESVLNVLSRRLFPLESKMALVLKQAPDRSVKEMVCRNFNEEERRKFLSDFSQGAIEESHSNWSIFPLSGELRKSSAILFVAHTDLEEKRLNILKIFLNTVNSMVENLRLLADLERQASIDGLTGTYNRAFFQKRFEEEMQKCRTIGLNFALIVIDLNGLKRVNDLFGHQAGDAMIIQSGKLIGQQIREHDILSRFGGDEYVILLPSTSQEGLALVEKRVIAAQEGTSYCFPADDGTTITEELHYSVGAASSEEVDAERVFNLADERMYESKQRFYQTREKYR